MRSPAFAPTIPIPITILVSGSAKILVLPSVRSNAIARPLACQGNSPFTNGIPSCLSSASVGPAHAISGSVNITAGIAFGSNDDDLSPEITSAATFPSCVALWASIGSPVISPIAYIFFTDVCRLSFTGMNPRSVREIPVSSNAKFSVFGFRPTETSTLSNDSVNFSPLLVSKWTVSPSVSGLISTTFVER